jgi:serine/threonine protein kinase
MMINIPSFTESDNETRVRESLVAPLLRALGYSDEDIFVEFSIGFRDKSNLRADYVISTEHEFSLPPNRIVVEVKRPSVSLSDPEVLDQARYYAAHRAVQATHIILINGLHLNLYETTGALPQLIRSYEVERLSEYWDDLVQTLGAPSLGRYFAGVSLVEKLGSGGYGQVFKAWNDRLRRLEALKVLHPGAEQAVSLLRRFERGAQGLATLEHPYICKVHDVNVYRERPYYRMELVDGISVTQYVNEGDISFPERIDLFKKICEALSHAHNNDVVHCDLKPTNVLVKGDGTPKLIDFDFCHIGSSSSTTLSQVVATIAYMDPTIWLAPQNRDVLADVYSMGLLLWSILTGKDLIPGWTPHSLVDELARIGHDAENLGNLVLACLQENRSFRPQSIGALSKLLGVTEWRMPLQGRLIGAVSNFTTNSPAREFEYQFRLWQQTGSLPVSTDFDRISKNIPQRPLTDSEQEFIFRAACEHWSTKYRPMFKNWAVDVLIRCAKIVTDDPGVAEANKGKLADTSPARRAIDILAATDEYRGRQDSEKVARFLLDLLRQGKVKNLFHTIVDDLARLQCFKPKGSDLRREVSGILIDLIRLRLPKAGKDSARQIGKLLEKLDPMRCGADTEEVAGFIREVANNSALFDRAVITLTCFENPHATDALIDILESIRGTDEFEKTALKAIGIGGRHKRPAVAKYLSESTTPLHSEELKRAVNALLNN